MRLHLAFPGRMSAALGLAQLLNQFIVRHLTSFMKVEIPGAAKICYLSLSIIANK